MDKVKSYETRLAQRERYVSLMRNVERREGYTLSETLDKFVYNGVLGASAGFIILYFGFGIEGNAALVVGVGVATLLSRMVYAYTSPPRNRQDGSSDDFEGLVQKESDGIDQHHIEHQRWANKEPKFKLTFIHTLITFAMMAGAIGILGLSSGFIGQNSLVVLCTVALVISSSLAWGWFTRKRDAWFEERDFYLDKAAYHFLETLQQEEN